MTTTSPYTIFNNVVSDMLSDLTERFSSNKELAACQMYHRMACKANIKLPYEKFVELAVVPFGDRLVSHDDSFFVEKQYNVVDEEGCGIVNALKKLWKDMSDEDKQRVHDYLDLLLGIHAGLARA